MASSTGTVIQKQIRGMVAAQCPSADAHLLQRFLADRDEAAFAELVKRHANMVFGVCRSVLKHQQDAEDAFQAAFLVLARKAAAVRKQASLGSWLHGVAYRLSLKSAARTGRRRERESITVEPAASELGDDLSVRELRRVVHEEMERLGEVHRSTLLLSYWEGKTRDEAAEQLGMTAGAFKKRLEQARQILGSRLARRGLALSAPLFAVLLSSSGVQAALPGPLLSSTAHAAFAFSVGEAAGATPAAVALAQGAIQMMNFTKWATTVAAVLLLAGLGAGLGLGAYHLTAAGDGGAAAGPKLVGIGKAASTDKERLVGTWRVIEGKADGSTAVPAEFVTFARVTLTMEGTFAVSLVEDVKKGKFDLVAAGQVDLHVDKDKALGIYQFDGPDRLKVCLAGHPIDRPAAFKAEKGSGNILISLVRAKPGEEKPSPAELAKLKPDIDRVKEAAARTVSVNNLKQIGLGFHNLHDTMNAFPAHAIYSKDGKTPLLSWRVAILPYIDHSDLYREFKLDEPWDSEHNKKLIEKMPRMYVTGGASKAKPGETHYQVVTGPGTLFDGAKKPQIRDITDGTSNTVLAIEAKNPEIWTKPADLTLPKDKDKLPAVGENFTNGFNALMCDGSVRFVVRTVAPASFRAFVTPSGGEVIGND